MKKENEPTAAAKIKQNQMEKAKNIEVNIPTAIAEKAVIYTADFIAKRYVFLKFTFITLQTYTQLL
jgi:hypothetical protein